MIRFTSVFIIVFLNSILFAQAPQIQWTKTIDSGQLDRGFSVQQTSDGGYIITGVTELNGNNDQDVWLIKTDANGDTLWTKTIGGSGAEGGNDIKSTSDGGYIIVGSTDSFGAGSSDVWLIKTDANGDTLWTKTFGDSSHDWGSSVDTTCDGGYIIAGTITSPSDPSARSVWLIKTDANGDTLWTKTFVDSLPVDGVSIQQTMDCGYIIIGADKGLGGSMSNFPRGSTKSRYGGVRLIETTANGDTLWTYGGVWLIKTDANGDALWTKTIIGINRSWGNYVQQTSDGGYIITGINNRYIKLPVEYSDLWLVKTNGNGDTMWTKSFGDSSSVREGNCLQQTADGGYIITGRVGGDIWLIKTDAQGDTLWTKIVGGSEWQLGNSVRQTNDGGYIIAGTSFFAGGSDIWLIRAAPDIMSIGKNQYSLSDYQLKQNYPNPFNPSTTIEFALPQSGLVTLKIYNILGEEVATLVSERLNSGEYKYAWDASRQPTGIYLYRMVAGDFVQTQKMILMK